MKRLAIGLTCLLLGLSGGATAQVKTKAEVDDLVKVLKTSKDPKARVSAANELAQTGLVRLALIRPTEPALIEALKDENQEVRGAALGVLGLLTPYKKERVPNLLLLLKDGENPNTIGAAAVMLGQTQGGAKEAIPLLEDIAKKEQDKAENLRNGNLLGQIGQGLVGIRANLIEGWIETVKSDKDAKQRAAAAGELAKVAQLKAEQAQPAIPVLLGAVRDEDVEVRKAALNALTLAKAQPQDMMPALISSLKNIKEDKALRLTVIGLLGSYGPNARDALPFLEFMHQRETKKDEKDRDKELYEKLTQSLEAIKKQ
jgi:HEAT repeat protein